MGRPEPRFSSLPWLARDRASRERPCDRCVEAPAVLHVEDEVGPEEGPPPALARWAIPTFAVLFFDELARLHGPQHPVRRPAPGEDGAAAEQHAGGPAGHLLPGQLLAGQPGHGLGRRPLPADLAARRWGSGSGAWRPSAAGWPAATASWCWPAASWGSARRPTASSRRRSCWTCSPGSSGPGSCRHSTWPCRSAAPWGWPWAGTSPPAGTGSGRSSSRGCRD